MSSFARMLMVGTAAAAFLGTAVSAQLLPRLPVPSVSLPAGNLPVLGPTLEQITNSPQARQGVRPTLDTVAGLPQQIAESGGTTLLQLRRLRLRELIREYRQQLESGPDGLPVRRGVLVTIDPDPTSLQVALRAGFRIVGDEADRELGIRTVSLSLPRGMSAQQGEKWLKRNAPRLDVDYDHLFEPAGGSLAVVGGALAVSGQSGRAGPVIGIIDGGVASHPSLSAASIEQSGFAGQPQATGHGTAVASLIVGNQGPFRGAARGASLLVADVYGGSRAAGSATTIVRALSWLASKRPQVINISLVGPQNKLVARAVRAVQARGIAVVAAVGNDGPAAPPQFPASHPGVVAITGVDGRGRALPEAGRAAQIHFAAPGADMAAALPGRGYTKVRGTSFAAPLAASRLAMSGSVQRLAAEARPGRGRVGRGIVCGTCRIEPKSVRAK